MCSLTVPVGGPGPCCAGESAIDETPGERYELDDCPGVVCLWWICEKRLNDRAMVMKMMLQLVWAKLWVTVTVSGRVTRKESGAAFKAVRLACLLLAPQSRVAAPGKHDSTKPKIAFVLRRRQWSLERSCLILM